jgi:hypothetical protein
VRIQFETSCGECRWFLIEPIQAAKSATMKMLRRVCLLAAIVVPGLTLADEPAPQAQSLATVEALLGHCAKLIPAAADRYRELAKLLAQGATEETLANLRQSEEYRASHDLTLESLAKVSEQDAKKACEQHLAQGQ